MREQGDADAPVSPVAFQSKVPFQGVEQVLHHRDVAQRHLRGCFRGRQGQRRGAAASAAVAGAGKSGVGITRGVRGSLLQRAKGFC